MLRYFYKNTHVSFTVNKQRYSSQVIFLCDSLITWKCIFMKMQIFI